MLSWLQTILLAITRTVPSLHTARIHSRVGWGKWLWSLLRCHLFHESLLVIIIKCQLSVIVACNGKSLLRTCSATCWWSTLTLNNEAILKKQFWHVSRSRSIIKIYLFWFFFLWFCCKETILYFKIKVPCRIKEFFLLSSFTNLITN